MSRYEHGVAIPEHNKSFKKTVIVLFANAQISYTRDLRIPFLPCFSSCNYMENNTGLSWSVCTPDYYHGGLFRSQVGVRNTSTAAPQSD
jgi:hypothetical protein